jgi:hypothetical protein
VRGLKTWCEVQARLWFLAFRGQEWCLYLAGDGLNSKRRKAYLSPLLQSNRTKYWGSKILPSEMHSNTIYIYISWDCCLPLKKRFVREILVAVQSADGGPEGFPSTRDLRATSWLRGGLIRARSRMSNASRRVTGTVLSVELKSQGYGSVMPSCSKMGNRRRQKFSTRLLIGEIRLQDK